MANSGGFERFFLESPGDKDSIPDIWSSLSSFGDWKFLEGTETIIRRIITNLFISRGSYVFDPELGSNIHKFIFEQADTITLNNITEEVRRVVDQNKGDVDITFNIQFFKNQKGFRINLLINTNGRVKKVPLDINETLLRVD